MHIINLPVVDQSLPAKEALKEFYRKRVRGLVATDGDRWWLHEVGEVEKAVRDKRGLTLKDLSGREVPMLPVGDAAAQGLEFAIPNAAKVQSFFAKHQTDLFLTVTGRDFRADDRLAILITTSAEIASSFALDKYWVCPEDQERFADKPADGLCPTHLVLVERGPE